MRFRTEILSNGKTAAGIEIPVDVLNALGTSRKPAVTVSLNGYTYRSTVATVNGTYMVGVSNDVRTAAGVAAGQVVDVDIELDTEPRVCGRAARPRGGARRRARGAPVLRDPVVQQQAADRDADRRREERGDARAPDREVRGIPARGSDLARGARDPAARLGYAADDMNLFTATRRLHAWFATISNRNG